MTSCPPCFPVRYLCVHCVSHFLSIYFYVYLYVIICLSLILSIYLSFHLFSIHLSPSLYYCLFLSLHFTFFFSPFTSLFHIAVVVSVFRSYHLILEGPVNRTEKSWMILRLPAMEVKLILCYFRPWPFHYHFCCMYNIIEYDVM